MRRLLRLLSLLFLLLLFAVSVAFTYYNAAPVELRFGDHALPPLPVSALLLGTFVGGGLLGLLCGLRLFQQTRCRAELRRVRRQLQDAEQEVAQLRSLTLKDLA